MHETLDVGVYARYQLGNGYVMETLRCAESLLASLADSRRPSVHLLALRYERLEAGLITLVGSAALQLIDEFGERLRLLQERTRMRFW